MNELPKRMPGNYYRSQAARVRGLAGEATTPAVKEHLRDLAARFERLAEGGDEVAIQALPDEYRELPRHQTRGSSRGQTSGSNWTFATPVRTTIFLTSAKLTEDG